jgi:hypothetical protein
MAAIRSSYITLVAREYALMEDQNEIRKSLLKLVNTIETKVKRRMMLDSINRQTSV